MRNGFSFVEVIISVVILSLLGVALIKFNSFNKTAMQTYIKRFNLLLISTPTLYKKIKDKKEKPLLTFTNFKNLTDSDRHFLNSHSITIQKSLEDKLFLYQEQDKKLYINYGYKKIKNKDETLNFLWIEK